MTGSRGFVCTLGSLAVLAASSACDRGVKHGHHEHKGLVTGAAGAGSAGSAAAGPPPFTEVLIDAPQGLSGLAADDTGVLWSVAERHKQLARITLDAAGTHATVERIEIAGVPAQTDLEGIEVLPDGGGVAIAAEGQHQPKASLLLAQPESAGMRITQAIDLPREQLGVELSSNHGAEAVCGDGRTLVVGIEVVGVEGGRRYAPIVRIVDGAIVAMQRLWLTSDEGKLSALDCRVAADGAVTGWAVERHYGTTRVLRVALPPPGMGGDAADAVLALDLEPWLHGRLNLEGIAELPDGRVVIVNDSQTSKTTGPTELLVFAPGALGR